MPKFHYTDLVCDLDYHQVCEQVLSRKQVWDRVYDQVLSKTSTKGAMDSEGARLLTYSTVCLHYAPPPIVLQQAAAVDAVLHALRRQCTSEGSMSSLFYIDNMKRTLIITHWLENKWKIWDGRSVGNVRTNVFAKFRCAPLRNKKVLGIF